MKPVTISVNDINNKKKARIKYWPLHRRFMFAQIIAILWMVGSIIISLGWIVQVGDDITVPLAVIFISGVAFLPGYTNAFYIISLLIDRQKPFKEEYPTDAVSILIAAYNEEEDIYKTLEHINDQDYDGEIKVFVCNNNSTDNTVAEVERAQKDFSLDLELLLEEKKGKFHALNTGLKHVKAPFVITLDADTIIHPSAVRFLVARFKTDEKRAGAVAGSMMVNNPGDSRMASIQYFDYAMSIAAAKRLQGMYQETLVAQGAFSLYKTDLVREIGGWPDAIGEDIVITWKIMQAGYRVYFEPLAVAFTDVPRTLKDFIKQRSRWARGMIEGLKAVLPWHQTNIFSKILTGFDLFVPVVDISVTFFWIPGLLLAILLQDFLIAGPLTLLVLPIVAFTNIYLYWFQKSYTFKILDMPTEGSFFSFVLFIFSYQLLSSPTSILGYIQGLLNLRRVWK